MEGSGREIAPGLHRIEAPLGERFVACYVIVGDEAAVLFDTGVAETPGRSIVPYCEAAGIRPESIRWAVISHCDVDHMGGDAAARRLLPDVRLLAHAADARLIGDVEAIIEERYREFRDAHGIDIDQGMIDWCRSAAEAVPVDIRIDAATELDLGGRTVRVLPTPGHSDGSISIWDPATRAALTSDAVLGESLHFADGRPAFPPTYRDPGPYLRSIETIEALEPAWLLTAHEPPMRGDEARAFLARSREFTLALERETRTELDAHPGGLTTDELIAALAPRVGEWDEGAWMFLANELVGHLEELQASGVVEALPGRPVTWRAKGAADR
jgi:glyoxylase-like metal-dependent hydrolase (beta-lactamase superfamily II)